jgi:hypothetical protein
VRDPVAANIGGGPPPGGNDVFCWFAFGSCVSCWHSDFAVFSRSPPERISDRRGRTDKGIVLRKFALLTLACTFGLLSSFVKAQQIDVALGAGILSSSKNYSATQSYVAPTEKDGIYPSFSADVLFRKQKRLGLNAEVAVRESQGLYNGYQNFRPVFYDVNAIYAPRLGKRITAEFMAGVGAETVLFYNSFGACSYASCPTNLNSTHFMGDIGGGVRYYFWRHFFARPEAHLYLIPNNSQFSSDYVGRVGVSLGYSLPAR